MKSRINLYQEQFKPQVVLLSLNFALLIWALAIITLVIVGFGVGTNNSGAKKEAQTYANQVSEKTTLLSTLADTLDKRAQDPGLLKTLEGTQKTLKTKQTIVAELGNRQAQKENGFSALMLDLANNTQEDVWLTRISLNESRVRIEGGTLVSAAVPGWVNKLSGAKSFTGKEFAEARMFRDEQEQLNFVLSSELSDSNSGGNDER